MFTNPLLKKFLKQSQELMSAGDIEGLKKSSVTACMQCGTCAYSCPAGKPLVQYLVLAKDMLREESAKK